MCKKYLIKAKDFLLNPSKAFEKERKTGLIEAVKYALILLIIGLLIFYIRLKLLDFAYTTFFVSYSIVIFIVLFLLYLFWLHLWAYIFGARNGLKQTAKAVIYGSTPSFLILQPALYYVYGISNFTSIVWTPIVLALYVGGNAVEVVIMYLRLFLPTIDVIDVIPSILLFITILWSLILQGIGLKKLHKITSLRIALVIIITIITFSVIMLRLFQFVGIGD